VLLQPVGLGAVLTKFAGDAMQRRSFLAASVAATAGTALSSAQQPAPDTNSREMYLLRRYQLRSGAGVELSDNYFQHALIPALNRLGIAIVGVFKVKFGPEMPAIYVLIPAKNAEILALLDHRLEQDAAYRQAAAPFLTAPASQPAYIRCESTMLAAFTGWPKLTPPEHAPENAKRLLQLRIYESPGEAAHVHKVAMFNDAEIAIFERAGLRPVFFGQAVIGPCLPNLTYMLWWRSLDEHDAYWAAFSADPEWKKLSKLPGNTDADIVSNITNLILTPAPYSQI
jgi:hypothetical protein